jgi:hypothetical protein
MGKVTSSINIIALERTVRKNQWHKFIDLKVQTGTVSVHSVDAIGINANSDSVFYLNADPEPDLDPGIQINADPCGSGSWSD